MSTDLKFHRLSIRLKNYDYSSFGYYFVTICAFNRDCLFGKIIDDEMQLSLIGQIAQQCWIDIPKHFQNIALDNFVIMPNHMHGIFAINTMANADVGVGHAQPLRKNTYQHMIPNSLCSIVNSYKSAVTKLCNRKYPNQFGWQRNYWEHVARDDDDLKRIRRYIETNPRNWYRDRNNPEGLFM